MSSRFARNVSATLAVRLVTIFTGIVSTVVLARAIGPSGRGLYAVAAAIMTTGLAFANLGLQTSNTFYVSRDRKLLPGLLGNSAALSLVGAPAACALVWVIFRVIPSAAPVHGPLLLLGLLAVPIGLAYLLFQNLLLGLQDFRAYNLIEFVVRIGGLALLVGLIAGGERNLSILFSAALAPNVVAAGWAWLRARRAANAPAAPSWMLLRRTVAYGIRAYLGAFFAFMLLRSDLLIVKYELGAKSAGYYSVAVSMADLLYVIPTIVGLVLFPRLAAMADDRERRRLAKHATVALTVLMVAAAAVSAAIARPGIELVFGNAFAPAAASFVILAFAMVFYGPNNIVSNYAAASGYPWFAVWVWLAALVVNVALNLVLIPPLGIKGSALASLVGYALVAIAQLAYFFGRRHQLRVRRDFGRIYAEEHDPWQIGDSEAVRYDAYRSLLLAHAPNRRSLLDLGCGLGAFLASLRGEFDSLHGVDVSPRAVERAAERFPGIEFVTGSIDGLENTSFDVETFDAIVCSDVLYYLPERGRRETLAWIASHLAPDGIALIAGWCPGGQYLEPGELRSLVELDFRIVAELTLESGHVALAAERKRRLVCLTFDYETWQPIPKGERIDWEQDVFGPTRELLDVCEREQATITLFAEMGEYLWLCENEPELAARMQDQWRDAVAAGHEIGLHLHSSWLPELGARRDGETWWWDWSKAKADDYPGDLTALIGRCKAAIEMAVAIVDPAYRVRTFRAGAYAAQPFRRLYEALVANGIEADSSVYAGGLSIERGYDYRLGWSSGQPYFANPYDPQLKAAPAESTLVEMPVRTFGGHRLLLDRDEGERFAERLIADADRARRDHPTSEALRRRSKLRGIAGSAYVRLRPIRAALTTVLPRAALRFMAAYGPDRTIGHDYHVAVGHTKGKLRLPAIAGQLRALRADGRFELVTLGDAASLARSELSRGLRSREAEAEFQVRRDRAAVLGEERNEAQSHRLQAMIPLDRERVLDLGCGAGYWSARIATLYPWMRVVGIDAGAEFIARAGKRHAGPSVTFEEADFLALPFADGAFDCVYADNSLEHSFDVDATLAEVRRVLRPGGALVAAIPSDARNPAAVADDHTWKTAPQEVELRLAAAGFTNIAVEEVDVLRTLHQGPYPPSRDRMMFVLAWKRSRPATQAERAREAMDWVYRRLDPSRSSSTQDAVEILAAGHAFCAGYGVALGDLLRREGIRVAWVTMEAAGHPRGRGADRTDTHSVVAAMLDGREHVLDPMSNVSIPHPLLEVMRTPSLVPDNPAPDERWRERGYELYATSYWYERVRRFQRHGKLNPKLRLWRRSPR